ncbi:hypothetical protein CRUP_028592 [Coryphaenoides rupestris]|nr:hypothetical protein CRUP_028592 [Coryphaenoides rupestris]
MAASSLQNSSSTITPSRRVMCPRSLFLTSRSLGVKSGMRWILNMRSPTTCNTGHRTGHDRTVPALAHPAVVPELSRQRGEERGGAGLRDRTGR